MRILAGLMPHKVDVELFLATTPTGPTFTNPATVRAYVEDIQQVVVDAAGQEIVSSTTVWVDPENFAPAGSRVTVWAGTPRQSTLKVVATKFLESRLLSHAQLFLGAKRG